MTQENSLVKVLEQQAARLEDKPYLIFKPGNNKPEQSLSFKSLYTLSSFYAGAINTCSNQSKAAVLLFTPTLEFYIAFFASLCAGKLAIPLPYTSNAVDELYNRRLQKIQETTGSDLILTTREAKPFVQQQFPRFKVSEVENIQVFETGYKPVFSPDACCLFSSGSTDDAKGIIHTHDSLFNNASRVVASYQYNQESITVSWLPHFHAFGMLVNIWYPLFSGSSSFILDPHDFAASPLNWLTCISEKKATHTGAPNFGFELCTKEAGTGADMRMRLDSLKVAFSAGENIQSKTLENFGAAFGKYGLAAEALSPMYGMSEASTISAKKDGHFKTVRVNTEALKEGKIAPVPPGSGPGRTVVSCGQIIDGARVVAIHPVSRKIVAPDEVGELCIAGPSLFDRYLTHPAKEQQFEYLPVEAGKTEKFLPTGDYGFIREGEVYITGRIKEVIIVHGKNHYPTDLEFTISRSHPLLHDARKVVFSVPGDHDAELIAAVIELPETARDHFQELTGIIQSNVLRVNGVRLHETVFAPVNAIPKTSSGKLQRRNCRELYLAGKLYAYPVAPQDPLRAVEQQVSRLEEAAPDDMKKAALPTLLDIFRLSSGIRHLTPDSPFSSWGIDSIQLIRITRKINEAFQTGFDISQIAGARGFDELINMIRGAQKKEQGAGLACKVEAIHGAALTANQQGLWIEYAKNLSPHQYNTPLAFDLSETVDLPLFAKAFELVQQKNPVLMSRLAAEDAGFINISPDAVPLTVTNTQLGREDILARIKAKSQIPFTLNRQLPLLYGEVFKDERGHSIFYMNASHLISDGESCRLFLHTMRYFYTRLKTGQSCANLAVDDAFFRFHDWEKRYLQSAAALSAERYWLSRKQLLFAELNLPYDLNRSSSVFENDQIEMYLPQDLLSRVRENTLLKHITPFSVFLGAYFLVLYRYTRQKALTVGTATANRPEDMFEQSLGYFSSVLPVFVQLDPESTTDEFLQNIYAAITGLLHHQSYPLLKLVDLLRKSSAPVPETIYQTVFIFQRDMMAPDNDPDPLFTKQHMEIQQPSICDLTFVLQEQEESMVLLAKYNKIKFRRESVQLLAENYTDVLCKISCMPDLKVRDLLEPCDKEKKLLASWNNTGRVFTHAGNLYTLFEEQAALHPEKTAVLYEDKVFSYDEIRKEVQKACSLLRMYHVQKGAKVGVLLPRSGYLPIVALSLLKLGAVYIPIDPELPEKRIEYILHHSSCDVIVASMSVKREDLGLPPCLAIEALAQPVNDASETETVRYEPDDSVYIIYTSGSTGVPKGVEVMYRGLANNYHHMIESPGISEQDVVMAITTISFDIAYTEIVFPLLTGASVCIASDASKKNIPALPGLITATRSTILQTTPTTLQLLFDQQWPQPTTLRKILSIGEPLSAELVKAILSKGLELWNMYGPTEASIEVTLRKITSHEDIDIGTPISNTRLYILDDDKKAVPVGVYGELCLAGECLAKGYYNKSQLSQEKFLYVEPIAGIREKVYRTGDIARFSASGKLYYLGRNDSQVKLRGFRVELQEIEHVLQTHPAIKQGYVLVDRGNGYDELKASVVTENNAVINPDEIRNHLREYLPAYMIPSFFYQLFEMPLLENGKINRKKLFENGRNLTGAGLQEKNIESQYGKTIAGIWGHVLQTPTLDPERNFYDHGGNSMLIVQLLHQIQQAFPRFSVQLTDLFRYTTIRSQARWLEEIAATDQVPPSGEEEPVLSVSFGQHLSRRELRQKR
ncbi:MAG: amino acid adenylation domain-containing protein [Williamsia sp.]|nr:amino acid adenylation domain-containing protein [Williamsia sp.]